MKRKIMRSSLLILFLFMSLSIGMIRNTQIARADWPMYVVNCKQWVSLRSKPDVNSTAIAQIPLGTLVGTQGGAPSGFTYVYYDGKEGYVLSEYLSDYPPSTQNTSNVSVRITGINTSQNDQYALYGEFSKYDTVYFHFTVSGLDYPSDIITVLTSPEGKDVTFTHKNCSNGYNGWSSFYYERPWDGASGTLYCKIYDSNWNLLKYTYVQLK